MPNPGPVTVEERWGIMFGPPWLRGLSLDK